MPLPLLLLLNLALACALTGLIWVVQVVQYPGLLLVGPAEFGRCHAAHTRRMGYVVAAPMLLEVALAAWLAGVAWPTWGPALALAQLAPVAVVWAVTFGLSVPFHHRLAAEGYSYVVLDALIRTNWLRTLAWTARGALLGYLMTNDVLH